MGLPDFLIIGAAKAGTTSLYYYLKEHPQIFMSGFKEPNFFSFDGAKDSHLGDQAYKQIRSRAVTDFTAYQALFEQTSSAIAVGEASTYYLHFETAAARIRRHIPHVKMICILRDPAERAYSAFLMRKRENEEPCRDLLQAIQDKDTRIRNGWDEYIKPGFYWQHLSRFLEKFSPAQLKIYLYEELNFETLRVVRELYRFLGVDESFVPNISARYNVSGIPRKPLLHALTKSYPAWDVIGRFLPTGMQRFLVTRATHVKSRNLDRPGLPQQIRHELIALYREDIMKLQQLIQRDLTKWLA